MAMGVDRIAGTEISGDLRDRRRALGMSTARLAEEVGVRPSDVGRWERGEAVPSATRIRAIARALGADQETMLRWIADAVAGASTDDLPEVQVVIDLVRPDPTVTLRGDGPADPFAGTPGKARPAPTPKPRPADPPASQRSTRLEATATRPRPVASVFPTPHSSLEVDRHVYVATRGFPVEDHPRLFVWGRMGLTTAGIGALTLALVWAFRQLGSGVADLVDLFGTPPG